MWGGLPYPSGATTDPAPPYALHQHRRLPHSRSSPYYGIIVHDHDVLAGRGINIAQHPGNERFRALVTSHADDDYCAKYSTTEKRAVAKQIIDHIRNLVPPGRFLRRPSRQHSARHSKGLDGPWEELSPDEVLKKTCQALRDCNRQDRTGYASAVAVPTDVRENLHRRTQTGLTNKQQAEKAAAKARLEADAIAELHMFGSNVPPSALEVTSGSPASATMPSAAPSSGVSIAAGSISPSIESAAHWLKQQRHEGVPDLAATPRTDATTPSTASATTTATARDTIASSASSSALHNSFDPSSFASISHSSSPYLASSYDAHPTSSSQPLSPARPDPYPYQLLEDEAATAAALAVAAATLYQPHSDQQQHLQGYDHHGTAALSQSSLSHGSPGPLDPLHLAASAVAALERHHYHQHQQLQLQDDAAATAAASNAMQMLHHDHSQTSVMDVADRLHHEHLNDDDHDDPLETEAAGDLRYSPVPASPFRDGDDFADDDDDDHDHHHLFD